MKELLEKLGISEIKNTSELLEKLEEKQVEYLDRIDNVEDEKRKQQLKETLMMIEVSISSLSFVLRKSQTGIARDKDSDNKKENFTELKKGVDNTKPTLKLTEQNHSEVENKTDEELYEHWRY